MGNITQQYIARVAVELLEKHPDDFTLDFQNNKKMVSEYCTVDSKNVRNKIAGYISRKVKQKRKEE